MPVPTGRFERRMAKAEVVELFPLGDPTAKIEAITENVSPRGARVVTNSMCTPGELVRLNAPGEDLNLPARVIYCQRLGENQFAVGLVFYVRVEKWQKPPNP